MKANTASVNRYYACKYPGGTRYPNAASKRYYVEKLVNTALAAAITFAAVVVIMVMFTI